MTLVTTSRRSTPMIRAIAKNLAFATGARYLSRGKHGLREIAGEHDFFIVIEQYHTRIQMLMYKEGEPCLVRTIVRYTRGTREGFMKRGIQTSDRELGSLFETEGCSVTYLDDKELTIHCDGPQRRCMTLVLEYEGTHEA